MIMLAENASCPGNEFNCSNGGQPFGANPLLAIPAIFSSSLSCISAVVIVFTYCRWKDIRTGSRAIVTYLSIADFFTAFGYIMGSLNYSINYKNTQGCVTFTYFCQIQSFITTTSSMSSFLWTCSLAIYLYLSLVHNKVILVQKLFPVFHIVSWVVPIVISFPLLVMGYLGYSYFAVSTWCYIGTFPKKFNGEMNLLILVAGKLWEIVAYIVVIILYFLIKRHIGIQTKKGLDSKFLNSGLVAILRRSDKKLVAIPVVFVLLRCWGTLHYFYTLAIHGHIDEDGCTSRGLAAVSTVLGIFQAIGDGGQGWGNFILYVMVSDRIRKKLFTCCSPPKQSGNQLLRDKSSSIVPAEARAINYGTVNEPPVKFNSPTNKITVTGDMEIVESYEPTTNY